MDFGDQKVFFDRLWWPKSILWWTLMIQKSSLKNLENNSSNIKFLKQIQILQIRRRANLVLVSRSHRKLFVSGVKVNKAWVRIDILVLVSKRTHSLSRPSHNNYLNTRVLLFYQHQRQHQHQLQHQHYQQHQHWHQEQDHDQHQHQYQYDQFCHSIKKRRELLQRSHVKVFDDYLRYLLVIMSSDLSDKTNGKEEVHSGTWL